MTLGEVIKADRVEWTPLAPNASLEITVAPFASPSHNPQAVNNRWSQLCRQNPRFHDGEVLAITEHHGSILRCSPRSFREVAVQPEVRTGCEILAVTAVVIATGSDGRPRLLLGQRHAQTRIYGGFWELGPSGGVPPPPTGHARLSEPDLRRQLEAELREEAGLSLADADVTLLGFARDLEAFSLDTAYKVAMRVPLEELRPAERDWEYAQVRWITPEEGVALTVHAAESLIPPTRFLLQRPELLGL